MVSMNKYWYYLWMDLKQIRYLVAVADAGSFSAGARRAFVTQPTLSAAIAALETELGSKLFERGARGVAPTQEGSRILDRARAILREIETIKAAGRRAIPRKALKVGLLPTLPPSLVAGTLARLAKFDPTRNWRIEDAPLANLRQRLTNGRYDVIFTSFSGKQEKGHRRVELAQDIQVLAVAKSKRFNGLVTPEILQGQPLIVRTHCELLQSASRILDDWQVRPVVVAKTDSDARALAMVAAGLGACLLPDSLNHEGVVFARLEKVTLSRRLGLEWVKGTADGWLDEVGDRL